MDLSFARSISHASIAPWPIGTTGPDACHPILKLDKLFVLGLVEHEHEPL